MSKLNELLDERKAVELMSDQEACFKYNVENKNEILTLIDEEIESCEVVVEPTFEDLEENKYWDSLIWESRMW